MKTNGVMKKRRVLIPLGILLALCLVLSSCYVSDYSSSSLEDYVRCVGRTHPWNCMLFPERGLLSKENCAFYDRFQFDGSHTPAWLTYAFCTFSEADFAKEKARLADTAAVYAGDWFEKPAYVLYLNDLGFSEYALIDEVQHTIHYICLSSKQFYEKLPTEDRLRPEYADRVVHYDGT